MFTFLSLTLFRSPSPTHYLICFSIIYLFYCSPSDWVAKGKQIKSRQAFNFIDLFWSDNVTLPRAQLLQQEQETYSKDEAVEWYWKVRRLVGNCYPTTLYKRLSGHWDWNKNQSKEGHGTRSGIPGRQKHVSFVSRWLLSLFALYTQMSKMRYLSLQAECSAINPQLELLRELPGSHRKSRIWHFV